MKNILIVVAHSDDETIGMGATIKKHSIDGDKVYVVSMTDGVGARDETKNENIINRKICAEKASNNLDFKWLANYDFKDNAMDQYSLLDIVKCVEVEKNKVSPDLVYTHSPADLNIDHRIVTNAVLTAFRPHPKEICKEIRLFEVASATDFGHKDVTGFFNPNLFVEITKTWENKFLALKSYQSELRDFPHSRSIEGIKNLAFMRGNQVGLEMAEAFQVIRRIEH